MTTRLGVVALLCCLLAAGCQDDPETLGPQSINGLVRLSDDSFGLLIYPCVDRLTVSEVVLREVELDHETAERLRDRVLLRERFREPVAPHGLVVSTDPLADPARPDAEREVDSARLDRFNSDSDYFTAIDPDHFLVIEAFAPDGSEIGLSGTVRSRFNAEPGEVVGIGSRPVSLDSVHCSGDEPPAWSVTVPS